MRKAILSLGALLLAGASVEPPRAGCMIARSGRVWTVYGIAGTFLLGDEREGCAVELSAADRHWTTVRETGRWWLLQIDRESGGETERIALDERADFAVAFGAGAAVTASGKLVEFRGRQWELTAPVEGLYRMSGEWVQVATPEGNYAIRPDQEGPAYLLPQGDEP